MGEGGRLTRVKVAIATEIEEWKAVEAKKWQGARNDLTDIAENLPQGPKASDEAGAMLGVSGRSVRDANPYYPVNSHMMPQVGAQSDSSDQS